MSELATIPGKHQQLYGRTEGRQRSRKTARLSRSARQGMAEFGIARFHAVRLRFIGQALVAARKVHHSFVAGPRIRRVLCGRWCRRDDLLYRRRFAIIGNLPSQKTAGAPVHVSEQVDTVFLSLNMYTVRRVRRPRSGRPRTAGGQAGAWRRR